MMRNELVIISLSAALGSIAFIEVFLRLPVPRLMHALAENAKKAMQVIRSTAISDHWKEKVLPRYAGKIFARTLLISFYLLLLLAAFGIVFFLSGVIFTRNFSEAVNFCFRIEAQIAAIGFGLLYAFFRKKIKVPATEPDSDYSFSDRVLHHIALSSPAIKEMAFDMDCAMTRASSPSFPVSSPVFVVGLARSGTTILLEALYATGAFTTLNYRDMPFVTAPFLWGKITKNHKVTKDEKKERAHGDQLYVNFDSPEAFEEVFWLTFTRAAYVKASHLEPHDAQTEVLNNYKKYVYNILARQQNGTHLRYLAKNNSNLLRIKAIRSAFPDALILVPFRNPLDHAKSLLTQHQRFMERGADDPFSLKYMNWLGHFEFGRNFKPFHVSDEALPENQAEPFHLDYWLRYWKCVYEYIIDKAAQDVIFFDYDRLCEQPDASLDLLEDKLMIEKGLLQSFSKNIRPARTYAETDRLQAYATRADTIFEKLKELCL